MEVDEPFEPVQFSLLLGDHAPAIEDAISDLEKAIASLGICSEFNPISLGDQREALHFVLKGWPVSNDTWSDPAKCEHRPLPPEQLKELADVIGSCDHWTISWWDNDHTTGWLTWSVPYPNDDLLLSDVDALAKQIWNYSSKKAHEERLSSQPS